MKSADEGRLAAIRRRCVRLAALAGLALLTASCASFNAPRSWLPSPEEVPESPVGSWIEMAIVDVRHEGAKEKRVKLWSEGEFLAVGAESVHVLSVRGLESIPLDHIKSARVAVHASQVGTGGLITMGGILSTASNGMVAILTAPLWIIVGSITTGAVSRDPLHDVPSHSWQEVSIYARFPQGLPAGFDAAGIRFDPLLRPSAGGAGMTDVLTGDVEGTSVMHASGVYRVRLVNGETLKVNKIVYSSQEVVHFHGVDGRRRQLRARDVIWIRDAKGANVTKLFLSPP